LKIYAVGWTNLITINIDIDADRRAENKVIYYVTEGKEYWRHQFQTKFAVQPQ